MSTSKPPPDQIVELLRRRDQHGLRAVFTQYGGALNGVITRIVKDEQIAEEVLQDALLKIWHKIELYDAQQSELFTWMMRIARNTAIDRVRLKGFQVAQTSKTFDPLVHDSGSSFVSTNSLDVDALYTGMDTKYTDVLTKVYLEGYSTSAAAEELNLPLGTVKTRLRTALSLLRTKLKSEKNTFLGSFFLSLIVLLLWAFL